MTHSRYQYELDFGQTFDSLSFKTRLALKHLYKRRDSQGCERSHDFTCIDCPQLKSSDTTRYHDNPICGHSPNGHNRWIRFRQYLRENSIDIHTIADWNPSQHS